jgi:hypothetical protein
MGRGVEARARYDKERRWGGGGSDRPVGRAADGGGRCRAGNARVQAGEDTRWCGGGGGVPARWAGCKPAALGWPNGNNIIFYLFKLF